MKRLIIASLVGICAMGAPQLSAPPNPAERTALSTVLQSSVAYANPRPPIVRRKARRTVPRVGRRHQFYRTLPRGCARAAIRGARYWRCGGIYYREAIRDGATVFVITTP